MRVLGLVASGAGGVARRLRAEVAGPAAARGWRLAVTLTPTAGRWFAETGEDKRLQDLTDLPVRWESRLPSQPKPHPLPDAVLVVPATANTVAKMALAVLDNQALNAVVEAMGTPGVPVVVRPQANAALRAHPMWRTHLSVLAEAGVVVSDADPGDSWTPLLDLVDA